MTAPRWQFAIDVGGTFTDVVARRPDGRSISVKVLSSGAIRGSCGPGSTPLCISDPARIGEPDGLWVGYRLALIGDQRTAVREDESPTTIVTAFSPLAGTLCLSAPLTDFTGSIRPSYELRSGEVAPVVAIRILMGLRLDQTIGPVDVRLGTTRATNALLERKGARTAFVTTKGFGDVLKIGYQDRPELFRLDIRKRDELAQTVIEIDERISFDGTVRVSPDETVIRRQLTEARSAGIEALAVCFVHSYVNPAHEELLARIAESVGFAQISLSSRFARLQKIVPRGDTTVVDAYLSGVIRGYVDALRHSMPDARIRLMTSSGGLIDGSTVGGKDTILSGPAGGVVGCAHFSRAAGFDRAIGFDMGGTSTDVCRIDALPKELEYQHETVKAGVRIMTPMLAIETVAAGGGSICAFDGRMMTVGPHSAGSDPGPACYGRGGPLTVTDMNLLRGRIVESHFPFALDRDVVEQRTGLLCREVNAATGSSLTPDQLAEGFVRIANEKMAAAIRKISIAKGYDPRDYVLTSFGGAAGQHACALGRMLGVSSVLCSPLAGVLSAFGIGVAEDKRIAERSVHLPLNDESLKEIVDHWDSMAADTQQLLLKDGVALSDIAPARKTMDLCYAGQSTLLTVGAGTSALCKAAFENQHRQLYGFDHAGRALEIRVLRLEMGTKGNQPAVTDCGVRSPCEASKTPKPPVGEHSKLSGTHMMVVEGKPCRVPLHEFHEFALGTSVDGPALIVAETSTVVVESGWRAEAAADGAIILRDAASSRRPHEDSTVEVDPIRLEVFNNQFAAIAEQMGATLQRTAVSTNVKERLDFSCAIFTPSGELVVNAPHIPVHLGGMSDCVKYLMEDVGRLVPGDVYITNDPFRGGSHLNDVTVITPVHDSTGRELRFVVASRAHHAEIGGKRPGSMPPDSTCLADEGVLIRHFQWTRNGAIRANELRALLEAPPYPSRCPDENLVDIAAQIAANQTGVLRLTELAASHGIGVVHAYMRHIQDAAEAKMRDAIRLLGNGIRVFEDRLDDGTLIRLTLAVGGDTARLDFSGTSPVQRGNLSANRSIVTSAVLYCFRCLINESIPLNAGVLAPIEIVLPECFLNPRNESDPRRCPAVAGGNVETSQRVVDTILGALGVAAASQGTMNNVLMGNDRFGYYETICGGAGAGPGFHGADAIHTHMTNTRLTDPEVLESRYPVRLVQFAIRPGSGGAGKFRGGCGVVREFEFLEPLDVSIISQRRTTAPYGVRGGGAGLAGRNKLVRAGDASPEELPAIAAVSVGKGDRLVIETPGGGGWERE